MIYLIVQTFILLLIAGLLGLIFGWYLTRISAASARSSLEARLRDVNKDLRELRTEMETMATAKSNCDTERRLLSDELAELRAHQDAAGSAGQTEALAALQSELDQCREALTAGTQGEVVGKRGQEVEPAAVASIAPPLQDDQQEEADDLRQIKGIGPKIAGILEELGIRRFDQIAAWTPENIDWVNAHLKFKGRVEREEWVSQARALIAARNN